MKRLITLFTLIAGISLHAQNNQPDSAGNRVSDIPVELQKQAYIYTLATKYNDPNVARMALYNLIATNPNNTAILDTLALLYLDYNQYASAALVAQDAMRLSPNDFFATEIAAVAFENLGVKPRAITNYEKLYLGRNDLGILYKVAFLQYEVKRYGEALNNADIVVESPKSEELKLVFPTKDNKGQQIALKVATVRLKGMIEQDRGNVSLAKDYFQKALDMAPDFEVLKQQIAELSKE